MDRLAFISGATGYVGSRVARELLARGWYVRALARPGSEARVPAGCDVVLGDALDAATFAGAAGGFPTYIHLVGTPHPAPWKGKQFRAVDLASLNASVTAAVSGGVDHFIYISVAHPAPVMKEYIAVRTACEQRIQSSGLTATVLRPWYVLGPGHWWPYALLPAYRLLEWLPGTRDSARRLGLVTIAQMTAAIVNAAESPPSATRILEVPDIRDNDVHAWTTSFFSQSV
jgi:uncharacterized protein YbjT (DUF2867 family)